jgi:hypothetical protein
LNAPLVVTSSLSLESFDILETGESKCEKFFSSSPLENFSSNDTPPSCVFDGKGCFYPSFSMDYYTLIQPYDEKPEIWKKINERLTYLDTVFDEEENRKKYQFTKKLLVDVLQSFNLKQYPLIGIDDNGQIGAEWHDGHDYKIISIIPHREDDISVSCVKKTGTMLHIGTTLAQLKIHGAKELSVPLGKLPW